jgi:cobalt-zinc-cadmium resistance protein CzcA
MGKIFPFVQTEIFSMSRILILFLFSLLIFKSLQAQTILTKEEAVNLALNNQRNIRSAQLSVTQQQQLARGIAGLDNPQITAEASPYEPLLLGVEQTFNLPGVYRSRKALQNERIRLAQLQLQGSQYDLKREVRLSFLQLQYFTERIRLFTFQDSVYQAIKISSKRFFEAGQINKLEELTATTQADKVRNDLQRAKADLAAEKQIFRFYTTYNDSVIVDSIETYVFLTGADTVTNNIQQQILQQQISIAQRALQVQRAELLPQISAGLLFPTTKQYERPIGYQAGISIPLWRRQNRSRIAAGQTAIEIVQAQQALEVQRLNASYRQALTNLSRELQSLNYYNTVALPQSRAMIETSQRLFQGGELNYIESLRNLITAFEIQTDHLETHRAYNESIINLTYLNGTL